MNVCPQVINLIISSWHISYSSCYHAVALKPYLLYHALVIFLIYPV